MKKFLGILLIMVLSFTICEAQNQTVDKQMKYADTYLNYTGVASDTIGTDSTWTYTVRKKTDARLFPYMYMEIDSISGTAADVYIIRQGKVTPSESYTNIDTVTWTVTTSDTTLKFDDSTARKFQYTRYLVKGSASTFKAEIQKLELLYLKY